MRNHSRAGLAVVAAAALLLLLPAQAAAQDGQSGGIDFNAGYQRSTSGRDAVVFGARAMATDRFPGTVIGRFAELAGQIGGDVDGEILTWLVRFELGIGLSTDWFNIFVATGIIGDAYQSIDKAADAESVEPGASFPLTLGLWVKPAESVYLYAIAEPAWVILVESREVAEFNPFGFGEEFRLRGGFGFDVDELHFRVDYTWHDVAPVGWHTIQFGVGPKAEALPDL